MSAEVGSRWGRGKRDQNILCDSVFQLKSNKSYPGRQWGRMFVERSGAERMVCTELKELVWARIVCLVHARPRVPSPALQTQTKN